MKECAVSAVHSEKVCLRLQCNYKQLRLNFITINREFPRGRGGPSRKNHGNSRGWGEYCEAPWNGKSRGVGGHTGKKPSVWGYEYFLDPHILNQTIKIQGKRLYSLSLKDVAWLEDAQLFF